MTACTNNRRGGSILMETLLVLPLFMVVLGGMFWIGDIKLARQKLMMADRYAAWNAGNRHRSGKGGIDGEIRNAFFRQAEIGDQSLTGAEYECGESVGWSAFVAATARARIAMPEWTRGWLAGSPEWERVQSPVATETLTGRVVGDRGRHVVLMRNRFGENAYRNPRWSPRMLADWSMPWDPFVWREFWPGVGDMKALPPTALLSRWSPSGPPGYEHRRHGAYIGWSD